MNKIKNLTALLLILGLETLFAQNIALKVRQLDGAGAPQGKIVTVEFSVPAALQQGLVLSFNDSTAHPVLTGCRVGDKDFWLKQSDQQPTKQHTVHWSLQKGALIVRFNARALPAGSSLSLSIADFSSVAPQKKISLFTLENTAAGPRKGTLLGEQTLTPQTGQ